MYRYLCGLISLFIFIMPVYADTYYWRGVDVPEYCVDIQTINVNTATPEQLKLLYRVGDVMAQRIIESRPYTNIEELDAVKGIGVAFLKVNQIYIAFEGETTATLKVSGIDSENPPEGLPTSFERVESCN